MCVGVLRRTPELRRDLSRVTRAEATSWYCPAWLGAHRRVWWNHLRHWHRQVWLRWAPNGCFHCVHWLESSRTHRITPHRLCSHSSSVSCISAWLCVRLTYDVIMVGVSQYIAAPEWLHGDLGVLSSRDCVRHGVGWERGARRGLITQHMHTRCLRTGALLLFGPVSLRSLMWLLCFVSSTTLVLCVVGAKPTPGGGLVSQRQHGGSQGTASHVCGSWCPGVQLGRLPDRNADVFRVRTCCGV